MMCSNLNDCKIIFFHISYLMVTKIFEFFYHRQHMTATIVEWFHLLLADANEDIIRSKMKGLNKNLFVQVSYGFVNM